MNTYKLTLLKGDGIGPEIVREAVKVLDAAAARYGFALSYTDALMGGCAIDASGTPLPEETVAACKQSDAVLLGNHGLVVCGKDIKSAYSLACNMEYIAELQYRAMCIGTPNVLTDEQMAQVMEKFKSYGQPGAKKTGY